MKSLLQIVPQFPGKLDGVGDYAAGLARALERQGYYRSIFASHRGEATKNDFVNLRSAADQTYDGSILHYVNYGYAASGLPEWLLQVVERLRQKANGRLLVFFHELYSTGPPWRRDFWTNARQKNLVRKISALASSCLVSNEVAAAQLIKLAPSARIEIRPIPASLGEPSIDLKQITERDPLCWVICGGTHLVTRSLQSFERYRNRLPTVQRPRNLLVVGGARQRIVEEILDRMTDVKSSYRPEVEPDEASQLLLTASYGWIDYFRTNVSASLILKSSSFANLCSHGVVPILASGIPPISLHGEVIPAEFARGGLERDRTSKSEFIYHWYSRCAAMDRHVRSVNALPGQDRCR